ncbi:MAG: hypothetical protein SW833_14965 [Cyanobacteriota bacterium]|nr:hypothetical protein [Cyanobacteriota bacterium]
MALRCEAVYYCSKRALTGFKAPGRILWYVSQSRDSLEKSGIILSAIRACSRLDKIVIGNPKKLYKQYRRLGIYNWKDLIRTAHDDLKKEIMAIQFSKTELFKKPITFDKLQEIIDRKFSVQSLFKISKEEFKAIYNEGTLKSTEK